MRVARLTILAATLTSQLLLSACGQKGPLYLPQDPSLTTVPATTSAEESSPVSATDKKPTDSNQAAKR